MTSKEAKEWLFRFIDESKVLRSEISRLEDFENRLNSGVSKYSDDGTMCFDTDAARQRHEDRLADYSEQKAVVEKQEQKVDKAFRQIDKALAMLSNPDYQTIARKRYLKEMSWPEIIKSEPISKAQIFRYHGYMLQEMVQILSKGGYE